MARALVIHVDGLMSVIDVNTLESLQAAVGGYIQFLPFTEHTHAYVNEEGKCDRLPFNQKATDICRHYKIGLADDDYIVGNMLILGSKNPETGEHDCEDYDIPEVLLNELLQSYSPLKVK